jgi:hypothetical protein
MQRSLLRDSFRSHVRLRLNKRGCVIDSLETAQRNYYFFFFFFSPADHSTMRLTWYGTHSTMRLTWYGTQDGLDNGLLYPNRVLTQGSSRLGKKTPSSPEGRSFSSLSRNYPLSISIYTHTVRPRDRDGGSSPFYTIIKTQSFYQQGSPP